MLKATVTRMEPGSLSGTLLEQDKHYVEFFEGVVSVMAQSPNAVQRDSAFRSLAAAISLFDEAGKFALLRDLITRCPFPVAKSVLITLIKDTIHRAWGPDSIFAGRRVLGLVDNFLRIGDKELKAADLLQTLDIYISSANLYVYLIMRDTHAINQTGVWDPVHVEATWTMFVAPLKSGIEDLRREIELETARVREEGAAARQSHSHGHSHGHAHGDAHGEEISQEDKLKVLHEQEFNVFGLETALQRIEETWAKHLGK